jgi:hypothetical protein
MKRLAPFTLSEHEVCENFALHVHQSSSSASGATSGHGGRGPRTAVAIRTFTTRQPNVDHVAVSVAAMDGAVLAAIPMFEHLPQPDRDRLAAVCSTVEVDADATLVHEGDFGYAMFAIVSGTAEVTKDGEVLRTLGPGDVFGEIAVLSSGRRTATVAARTPMELIAVMNRDVWRLEREAPDIGAALRKTIADCLQAS